METTAAGAPAVTAFLLGQLRALCDEADSIERMASERHGDAALCEAMDRFRHRLAAHLVVVERLLVAPLRGCREYRDLLALEDEHEDRVVRAASAAAMDRLASIPPWRAPELFECAGGPTETWPGEWLG
jgi:hypothetical protein